jgi:RNA polymerase sigma-70 factor (ECF subfamily)
MDEAALLRGAQQGDLDAFNRLVLAHQGRAFALASRMLGDSDAAADVTQQTFLSFYRHLSDFRGGSLRAYILRSVTNACYDELRRRKRRPSVSLEAMDSSDGEEESGRSFELADPGETPEDQLARSEIRRAIEDCLRRLSDEQRAVVLLADVQAMDYSEVAAVMQTALGTVKSRLARARANLRDCLAQRGELLPEAFRLEGKASA